MDLVVTATEANQRFSEILREVDAGNSVAITRHGRVVAEVNPPKPVKRPSKQALEEMLARLDKLPGVVAGPWTRDELYDR